MPGRKEGQILSYPQRKWLKKRYQYLQYFMLPKNLRFEANPGTDGSTVNTVSIFFHLYWYRFLKMSSLLAVRCIGEKGRKEKEKNGRYMKGESGGKWSGDYLRNAALKFINLRRFYTQFFLLQRIRSWPTLVRKLRIRTSILKNVN